MSERDTTLRTALVTYFPMFIATLSLVTSIFNGYLNAKFIDIIQRNVGRGEYMRTCKDAIDAYFQVKSKANVLQARATDGAAAAGLSPELAEGLSAVSRFAALGTYLANLRDDAIRARYTDLSLQLEKVMRAAAQPGAELSKLFEPTDRLFGEMNEDCIKSAKAAPM
jgi:hypothetical protein